MPPPPLLLQGNGIVGAQGDNVASLLKHMTSLNVLKLAGEVRGVIWSGGGDIISNQWIMSLYVGVGGGVQVRKD